MKETTVSVAEAVTAQEAVLPARVQEALGELVGASKEGLLALSVGVGLGVMAELIEEEVTDVVGPKGRHDPDRVAVRRGHEAGEVTLGGRRVAVERPRVRTSAGTGHATRRLIPSRKQASRPHIRNARLGRISIVCGIAGPTPTFATKQVCAMTIWHTCSSPEAGRGPAGLEGNPRRDGVALPALALAAMRAPECRSVARLLRTKCSRPRQCRTHPSFRRSRSVSVVNGPDARS